LADDSWEYGWSGWSCDWMIITQAFGKISAGHLLFPTRVYDLRRKTALPCCLGIHCVDRSPLTLVARSLNMLLGHRTHHIY
jgi:hypothetical protein